MADFVPLTHSSFVAMWFSASLPASILAISGYFFFAPNWLYFLIAMAGLCFLSAIAGAFILVESPMQLILSGETSEAAESFRQIKKFN